MAGYLRTSHCQCEIPALAQTTVTPPRHGHGRHHRRAGPVKARPPSPQGRSRQSAATVTAGQVPSKRGHRHRRAGPVKARPPSPQGRSRHSAATVTAGQVPSQRGHRHRRAGPVAARPPSPQGRSRHSAAAELTEASAATD